MKIKRRVDPLVLLTQMALEPLNGIYVRAQTGLELEYTGIRAGLAARARELEDPYLRIAERYVPAEAPDGG